MTRDGSLEDGYTNNHAFKVCTCVCVYVCVGVCKILCKLWDMKRHYIASNKIMQGQLS